MVEKVLGEIAKSEDPYIIAILYYLAMMAVLLNASVKLLKAAKGNRANNSIVVVLISVAISVEIVGFALVVIWGIVRIVV